MPFNDWMDDLDFAIRQRIRARLQRLIFGNFGDCKALGDSVNELRIDFGPGYRIYYTMISTKAILILCAGSKRTQNKDIEKAKKFLTDFRMGGKKNGKK